MSEAERKHLTFVESVLRRPTMYTFNGTFEEVTAFLEGYYSGLSLGIRPGSPGERKSEDWWEFVHWLEERVAPPKGRLLESFRDFYGSGERAMEAITPLAEAFFNERYGPLETEIRETKTKTGSVRAE